jgi:hypothetical protein
MQNPMLEEVDEVTEEEDIAKEDSPEETANQEAEEPAEEDPIDWSEYMQDGALDRAYVPQSETSIEFLEKVPVTRTTLAESLLEQLLPQICRRAMQPGVQAGSMTRLARHALYEAPGAGPCWRSANHRTGRPGGVPAGQLEARERRRRRGGSSRTPTTVNRVSNRPAAALLAETQGGGRSRPEPRPASRSAEKPVRGA